MKKHIKSWVCLVLAFICTLGMAVPAFAGATTFTFSLDRSGNRIRTQDAFLPGRTLTTLGLFSPEDIFICDDNRLFIADTGNRRIIVYDIRGGEILHIVEHGGFSTPRGVFVNARGELYVADARAEAVFHFDAEFNLLNTFTRPTAIIFGDTLFAPTSVVVDNRGNLYIVGEGLYGGILQMSANGDFLGYFTTNRTTITLAEAFRELFYTREQREAAAFRLPPTFSNVTIDHEGIIYTTTGGQALNGLRKHNTAGNDMFMHDLQTPDALADVVVDRNGIIYAADRNGGIYVYTRNGEFMFAFGGFKDFYDIAGTFTDLVSIAIDADGDIWTLDREKGFLQSFTQTEYTAAVFAALSYFEQGKYMDAYHAWLQVLARNEMSALAHNGIGMAYLYMSQYEQARTHFMIAGNRDYYSEAFWEIRYEWLQRNLPTAVAVLVGFFVLISVIKRLDRKEKLRTTLKQQKERLFDMGLFGEVIYFLRVPFHPIHCFYDIRMKDKGTPLAAMLIYVIFFGVFLLYQTSLGFIFQAAGIESIDLSALVVGFGAIIVFYVVCNFLMAAVSDGEGTLAQVFIYPAYSAFPLLMAMVINIGLSYILTQTEVFFFNTIFMVGAMWSVILLLLGLQEMHNYDTRVAVKSIVLTVLFMMIIIVVLLIVAVIWDQLYNFVLSIGRELIRNVQTVWT